MFFDDRRRIWLDEEAHVGVDVIAEPLLDLFILGDAVCTRRERRSVAAGEENAGGDALGVVVDQPGHWINSPSIPIKVI
jgi:hypothetical protein